MPSGCFKYLHNYGPMLLRYTGLLHFADTFVLPSFFPPQLEHERQVSAVATEELQRVKKKSEATQIAYEQEEEFITNRLLGRLEDLKADRAALAKQVEAEEDFLVNTLQRRLAKLHQEKAAVEAKLQGEQDSAATLQRRLTELSEEKKRLVTERAHLENTLEAEQEHISLRLTKQIEKLAAEKANLAREKADLARQVGDLSSAVARTRREKVMLENTLEAEEEAATNRLQRQLEQVTNAYRALEARLEAHGVAAHAEGAPVIDPTIEWVYSGRSPSRASDRIITNARRERSLSVSSSSSMRDAAASLPSGRPSFDTHLHTRESMGGGGGAGSGSGSILLNQSHSGPPTGHQSAASSPDHRRRLAALNSQAAAAALIGALQSQTLSQ
jgi:coiled-coil domain-containing protein 6